MNEAFIRKELAASVTPEQQVAIARIAEEAAEIAKEAMKALRFGPKNRHPEGGPTNAEKIVAEFNDLRSAIADAGMLTQMSDELQAILGSRPVHECAGWDCANCHERDIAIAALLGAKL